MCDFCTKFDDYGDRDIKEETINFGVLGTVSVRVIAISSDAAAEIDEEPVMGLDVYMEVKSPEGYTLAEKQIDLTFHYCPQCGRKF